MPFEFPDDGAQEGVLWCHMTSANRHVARSLARHLPGRDDSSTALARSLAVAGLCALRLPFAGNHRPPGRWAFARSLAQHRCQAAARLPGVRSMPSGEPDTLSAGMAGRGGGGKEAGEEPGGGGGGGGRVCWARCLPRGALDLAHDSAPANDGREPRRLWRAGRLRLGLLWREGVTSPTPPLPAPAACGLQRASQAAARITQAWFSPSQPINLSRSRRQTAPAGIGYTPPRAATAP